jgi:glucosamine--fructose-6-phosphate aminotransferase (isomerizing)
MSLKSEIFEQPVVLRNLILNQRETAEKIAATIQENEIQYTFLAARGTSDNAGRYANYLWGAHNQLPMALATPSLFTYYKKTPLLKGALVVGVSQSGKSPDIVCVLEEGKRQGCLRLAITNNPQSPLAEQAGPEMVFDIQAGDENAVAATKTYTSELTAIAMLSAALANDERLWRELENVPDWIEHALLKDEDIARMAQRYRYMTQCVVLGRGFNYATAFEWALKLKELTYVVAEPYSSADFQHGPIAMVEGGFPIMAVSPKGKVFESMAGMITRLRHDHLAELVIISDDMELLQLAQSPIPLPPGIPEWLTPLVSIVQGQLFAFHLTQVKGFDTTQPRTIQKVTETR